MNQLHIRASRQHRTTAPCAALATLLTVFASAPAWAESQWNHEVNIQAASIDVATGIRQGDMSKSSARMAACLDGTHPSEKEAEYCVALSLTLSDAGRDLRRVGSALGDQVPPLDAEQDSRDILGRAKIPASQDEKVMAAIRRVEKASYETSVAPEVRAAELNQRLAALEASRKELEAKLAKANQTASTAQSVDGDWSGTFSCGPNPRSASTNSPFSVPASMHVSGAHVESSFENPAAVWTMSGTVDQAGHVMLSGRGVQQGNAKVTWAMSFVGNINGNTFSATGAEQSFDGLTKFRACKLTLVRR